KRRRGIRMLDAPRGSTDANTIKNFTMHARRGHHHCRDKVTSAHPVAALQPMIHRYLAPLRDNFDFQNEAWQCPEMTLSGHPSALSGSRLQGAKRTMTGPFARSAKPAPPSVALPQQPRKNM